MAHGKASYRRRMLRLVGQMTYSQVKHLALVAIQSLLLEHMKTSSPRLPLGPGGP